MQKLPPGVAGYQQDGELTIEQTAPPQEYTTTTATPSPSALREPEGTLPFTGLDAGILLAVGVLLLSIGAATRKALS